MAWRMAQSLTVTDVSRALSAPLPGPAAHSLMATRPRMSVDDFCFPGPPRRGAVLVVLYAHQGEIWLPLTRRTDRVQHHKGQIALPGGAWEPRDADLWATALRETEEEVGIAADTVRQLGALSPLDIPASHFRVQPFVGCVPQRPAFVLDAREVAALIEMPLAMLLDATAKDEEVWGWGGQSRTVPFYRLGEHIIWGATAMILGELETALNRLPAAAG